MNLEIVTVDIYPSKAKFVFAVKPESEYFDVEIPGTFDIDSVRILSPVEIEWVRIFTAVRENWIPPSLEELQRGIDEHSQTIKKLNARKLALEQTQILLQNAMPPTQTDTNDIISYIRMAQDIKLNAENDLADIETALKEENRALQILATELQERMPDNSTSVIRIAGRMKSSNKLFIEAFTKRASWTPQYVMDLNSKTGEIIMRLYSHTQQKTGLDYTGQVTFHTKNADESVVAPREISPLHVSIQYDEVLSEEYEEEFVQVPYDEYEKDDKELAESLAKFRKTLSDPKIEMTLFDHAIEAHGTLTGDGRRAEFVLGDTELTGEMTLELIPEQRKDAWIIVKISNVSTSFIPCKAVLKVDGHQTGNIDIPEYGLGQKSIPFGYIPRITVRKERHESKKDTSLFNTLTCKDTIIVENGTDVDRKVTVKDRLPVSIDQEKVILEIKSIEPAPKEHDKDNRLTWELDIKAGETVKIDESYTLSYPLKEELVFS